MEKSKDGLDLLLVAESLATLPKIEINKTKRGYSFAKQGILGSPWMGPEVDIEKEIVSWITSTYIKEIKENNNDKEK